MDINIQTENSSLYLFYIKGQTNHIEGFKGLDAGREHF